MVKIITGTIDKTPAALICPQSISRSVTKVAMATGNVRTLIEVRMSAIKNSFQEIINEKILVATKPGPIIGSIIRYKVCQTLQPSNIADSSSSLVFL